MLLTAARPFYISVGRLGNISGDRGFYIYVGSAFGPGGLLARVGRHWREAKPLRWHIDYLRQAAEPFQTWYIADHLPLEHLWAKAVMDAPGATVPMPGFGASDCRCQAHLFYIGTDPDFTVYRRKLETVNDGKLVLQEYPFTGGK